MTKPKGRKHIHKYKSCKFDGFGTMDVCIAYYCKCGRKKRTPKRGKRK